MDKQSRYWTYTYTIHGSLSLILEPSNHVMLMAYSVIEPTRYGSFKTGSFDLISPFVVTRTLLLLGQGPRS